MCNSNMFHAVRAMLDAVTCLESGRAGFEMRSWSLTWHDTGFPVVLAKSTT